MLQVDWFYYPPGDLFPVKRQVYILEDLGFRVKVRYQDRIYSVLKYNLDYSHARQLVDLQDPDGYTVSMTESPRFQLRIPDRILKKMKEWADMAGLSLSEFIILCVLRSGEEVSKMLLLKDDKKDDICHVK